MTDSNVLVFKPRNGTSNVISRGQLSWLAIKSTTGTHLLQRRREGQLQQWRDIGDALLVGRRLHPSNQRFSSWCKEVGFGDMGNHLRADTMWVASNFEYAENIAQNSGDYHPTRVVNWDKLLGESPAQYSRPRGAEDREAEGESAI